jgi:integrase
MRRGELLALRWSDLDLDAAIVRIERSVNQIAGTRIYGTPKNHERREIALDPHVVATLRVWRSTQVSDRLLGGEAYVGDEDLVFTWGDGRPLPPDYVTRTFGTLTSRSGAPRLRFHELRHTHAPLLLREGVPVHVVAKRLGHKDPSVTLDVYADAIPDDDDRAVATFAKAVWGREGPRLLAKCQQATASRVRSLRRETPDLHKRRWGVSDLNRRPTDYESAALTD